GGCPPARSRRHRPPPAARPAGSSPSPPAPRCRRRALLRRLPASLFAEDGRDHHAVTLRLQKVGGPAGLVLARDQQRQRAAAFRRHVVELEVLDVDPLGAERLGDPRHPAPPAPPPPPPPPQPPRTPIPPP